MGVTTQTFNFLNQWINPNINSIGEFGDQQFLSCSLFQEKSFTRTYWVNKGIEYDSMDIHGHGKTILFNLNKDNPITKQYDVLTDIGTFEHVRNFYMALKNMHQLCKINGMMIHILPAFGHWPNHGPWRTKIPFWYKLGKANSYKIRAVHEEKTYIGGYNSDQIYIVYEKIKETQFVSEEDFNTFGLIQAYEFEDYEEGKIREENKSLYK